MDPTHSVDGPDRSLDSGEHDAKPSGKFVRKIARFGEVLTGLEQNNDREPHSAPKYCGDASFRLSTDIHHQAPCS
jgi:hypothetical protein